MNDEQVDVVDQNDKPTGRVVGLKEAHAKNIPHRVAVVLVFRPDGRLIVQVHKHHGRRLDHSVGGHVVAGESYETAAKREMEEELGLKVPLTKVREGVISGEYYRPEQLRLTHVLGVFRAQVSDDWQHSETDEVDQLIEIRAEEIVKAMNESPDRFLQGFMASLGAYLKVTKSSLRIRAYGKNWNN